MSWSVIDLAGRPVALYRPARWLPRSLAITLAASLLIHLGLLLLPQQPKAQAAKSARLQVRLAEPQAPVLAQKPPMPAASEKSARRQPSPVPQRQVMTAPNATRSLAAAPKWSKAEKSEMDNFLNELDRDARQRPPPSLMEQSRQMARASAINSEREAQSETALLELRPNAEPPDPFAVDLYFEGVVRQLNRQAAYVKTPGRNQGVRKAMVAFRLNPDGSLKSFKVLNAGDQEDEIAYVRAIVERAAPFGAFPPELARSARNAGVVVCINPANKDGGVGFQRLGGNKC